MSSSTIKQLPKTTVELEIHIPWEEIKSTYEKILDKIVSETEISGFRKGKAPKDLVSKNLDKSKLYEEVVKEVIPKAYREEIQKHKLTPIIPPKVEVLKAKENEEWVVKTTIALKPLISLNKYKEKIKEFKKGKIKIWTPGSGEKKDEGEKKLTLDEIVKLVMEEAKIELSEMLIEQEANRLLSDLIDQTQKLGLSVEQYLMAKGKTTDQIRSEYTTQAEKNLAIEFIISEIADEEKITVSQEDLDKLINKAEKEEEKEKLRRDSYYLAHLIRQQKTLDFLGNL